MLPFPVIKRRVEGVIPIGHLYYFDANSLGNLLTATGFINVENLTEKADFAKDLEYAEQSGLMKLTPAELESVKATVRLDARRGPANGREESLVMCARKPWDSSYQQSTYSERIPQQA